ncbi:MAG TPA: DUF4142 domain-containing protein, partial [Pyrinomonadaceae bacterium]|nr:DUF4142 domain-containing protein [Pyrinomonadaceae bacterium]
TTFLVTVDAAVQDNFWTEAAMANMTEIAAANVALQRSQNERVKEFAQHMVTEHTAMGTELQSLAAGKNATLPTTLDSKHQSSIEKLGAKTGADFDRDFMKMMVSDHQKMARMLEREAERNSDADVKAFAAKNLPAVQQHLASARTLNDSLRGGGGSTNRGNSGGDNSNRGNNTNRGSTNAEDTRNNSNNNNTGFSNLRPNVNREGNTNTNTNSNRNTNRNTNSNRNRNTNGNSNNSNVNRL